MSTGLGASDAPAAPKLTDEQELAAARRAEPLLLSAAAGSGKTSVLVERFVRAVREDGIAPARILAITFTERAAGELRERVRARLLELGEREAARDTDAAFVSTFHGFCARLLRAHPLLAGLDPEFTILDEGLSGRLRGQAFRIALRDFLEGEPADAVDLIAAYRVERVAAMIEGVHARMRSQGQLLPRLPPQAPGAEAPDGGEEQERDGEDERELAREARAACVLLDRLLAGFGDSYERLKRARGAVDFDDLELLARALLEQSESVRAAWSERFELLMVDEFQDTNRRQLGILTALDRENLFTVGDEFQSIYGFRHAEVSVFRDRRAELAASEASLALTHNFRSRAPLLDVVNAVFGERLTGFQPLVAARRPEPAAQPAAGEQVSLWPEPGEQASLWPELGVQPEPGAEAEPLGHDEPLVELLLTARSGWEASAELAAGIAAGLPAAALWRQAEARTLAARVAELVASGRARAGEVVVLLRAGGDQDVYERALQLRGLRTLAAAGGFWAHQQIGDLVAYLRALANPLDELALYSVLASPLVGVSRDGLALLARAASEARRPVWELASGAEEEQEHLAVLSEADRSALEGFCTRLADERSGASRRTISQLLERAIAASGYREHVLSLDWGERRLANVHKLLRLARRFEASEGRDLRSFLDHVEHLQDPANSRESDAPVEGVEPDAVRIMSIHAAKGLEFPVVCVADLGRMAHTGVPDLLVDGDRVGLRLVRLDGQKGVPALEYEALCEERRRAEAEEEDRILYVAMTRARERLLLSAAVEFERWPAPRQGASAISWLGPALAAEIPALAQALHPHEHELAAGPAGATRVRCVLSSPSTFAALLGEDALAPAEAAEAAQAVEAPQALPAVEAPEAPYGSPRESGGEPDRGARAEPLVAAERPSFPSAAISTLSYTALAELERCAYRYYLERVLGMAEIRTAEEGAPRRGGLDARARGTLIHALLERLDFRSPHAPEPAEIARVARALGIRAGAEDSTEISLLIDGALGAAPARRVAAARRVRREHPFAFSLAPEEPLITGVIDLLADEDGERKLVLDYKSDHLQDDTDLAALVEREYAVQRLLYALAVLRDGGSEVEIVHWFLHRPHEPVTARFAATDMPTLERRLGTLLAAARSQRFSVSPHPHRALCLSCPGRGGLCSWGEQETSREDPEIGRRPPDASDARR
jgi:ATP-dependent helicase/nuclease subunit A